MTKKLSENGISGSHLKTTRGAIPAPPSLSGARAVSVERRAELDNQIERGEFQAGFTVKGDAKRGFLSNVGVVKGLIKQADMTGAGTNSNTMGSAWSNEGGIIQGPQIYSPLWLTSNMHLPRERGTMNAWCRAFFALNPIVNNALSLHATYPISKLNVTCPDKKIENFFGDMAEEMDLLNTCIQIAQEFFVIGEAFPYTVGIDDRGHKSYKRVIVVELTEDGSEAWCELNG